MAEVVVRQRSPGWWLLRGGVLFFGAVFAAMGLVVVGAILAPRTSVVSAEVALSSAYGESSDSITRQADSWSGVLRGKGVTASSEEILHDMAKSLAGRTPEQSFKIESGVYAYARTVVSRSMAVDFIAGRVTLSPMPDGF